MTDTIEATTYRDGDIYHWRWRDDARHNDCGPYRSYHCRSRIAVVRGGRLFDTFWSGGGSENELDPEKVVLTLQGNISEMNAIHAHETVYYRPEDIVDMRHSNDSRAPVYLRAGAKRDADTIRVEVSHRMFKTRSEIESAERSLRQLEAASLNIALGKLDDVWL